MASLKGTKPAARAAAQDPISENKRTTADAGGKTHLQFVVPKSIGDEFKAAALEKFGMDHGSKTKLFLHLLEHYQATK
ncbi:hypothetical protein [Tateyamaria sp.]|uniref:hypothetical protein n=1 Tax=Tateyamaria sp. TaxID=1929288 RepID=UPI003B210AE6